MKQVSDKKKYGQKKKRKMENKFSSCLVVYYIFEILRQFSVYVFGMVITQISITYAKICILSSHEIVVNETFIIDFFIFLLHNKCYIIKKGI